MEMTDQGALLGSVIIHDYISPDGHHSYSVDIEGELEVVTALGLLRLAEHDIVQNMLADEIEEELEDDEE
jgi:hypothetical protein